MDPTTVFCPNEHCHARGQAGQGNIGIHARKEQRFICHECHKTFSATKGTVFYRLRTAAETVVIIVTLLAHCCPVQAIVAVDAAAAQRLGALAEAWGAEPHIYSQEDTERALGTSCTIERLVQMWWDERAAPSVGSSTPNRCAMKL